MPALHVFGLDSISPAPYRPANLGRPAGCSLVSQPNSSLVQQEFSRWIMSDGFKINIVQLIEITGSFY